METKQGCLAVSPVDRSRCCLETHQNARQFQGKWWVSSSDFIRIRSIFCNHPLWNKPALPAWCSQRGRDSWEGTTTLCMAIQLSDDHLIPMSTDRPVRQRSGWGANRSDVHHLSKGLCLIKARLASKDVEEMKPIETTTKKKSAMYSFLNCATGN